MVGYVDGGGEKHQAHSMCDGVTGEEHGKARADH